MPFFFVRMDRAGNVSKRFSAGRSHFSNFGGSCPLWNIHSCFETPERAQTQVVAMPDGTTYFPVARRVTRQVGTYASPAARFAIGLGCDIAYAPGLIYAQDLDPGAMQPVPIGGNCYLCERPDCPSRAYPPINRQLRFPSTPAGCRASASRPIRTAPVRRRPGRGRTDRSRDRYPPARSMPQHLRQERPGADGVDGSRSRRRNAPYCRCQNLQLRGATPCKLPLSA
ncbi:MAG: DUF2083 domain-containing protein [Pseudodonghicola sp.]